MSDQEQRVLPFLWKQRGELRLETVAKLVGEEASGVEATREPLADGVEPCFHLAWARDGDDPFGPLKQQRPSGRARSGRGQAVIEENERGGGHSIGRSHPLKLASIAHMGVPQVNIEGFGL
jgi:hypothetical protein